jgi:uncharacterized damage-inducible protein DinB
MTEVEKIADQLRRAYEGEAWHGPALRELLAGVKAPQAAAHPVAGAHSIWGIVRHIGVWEEVGRRRLSGEVIGELPVEQDWPAVVETSETAWLKALKDLDDGHQQLQQAIAVLSDRQLAEPLPVKGYTIYFMLHGLVQHALYHAGQIAVLKKAGGAR